eukprot:110071-Chlamydomonas_euryale.AAC.1
MCQSWRQGPRNVGWMERAHRVSEAVGPAGRRVRAEAEGQAAGVHEKVRATLDMWGRECEEFRAPALRRAPSWPVPVLLHSELSGCQLAPPAPHTHQPHPVLSNKLCALFRLSTRRTCSAVSPVAAVHRDADTSLGFGSAARSAWRATRPRPGCRGRPAACATSCRSKKPEGASRDAAPAPKLARMLASSPPRQ